MCVFLYTMPVYATEINTSETPSVEEGSDSVMEADVEEDSNPQPSSSQTEESTPQSGSSKTEEENTPQPGSSKTEEESIPQSGSSQTEESAPQSGSSKEGESSEPVSSKDATEEGDVEQTTDEVTTGEVTTEEVTTTEATTEDAADEESPAEGANTTVPDVAGMSEEEAVAALEAVEFEDGTKLEVIKVYQYTDSAEAGAVYEVSLSDVVSEDGTRQVTIYISEGEDPDTSNGAAEVNWDEIPESYEYNWDNSQNCWNWGVWIDGECYKTPEGTYDTNVRHKIQLYSDDNYVYTRIVFSRDYQAAANGNWFNYTLDGQTASFQVEQYDGKDLANNNLAPGTYGVAVRHANGDGSYSLANGASATYIVNDSLVNAELEIRIPLSEFAAQNSAINLDSVGTIEFFTPNLMYQSVKIEGASTSPLASAVAALVVVPGTALFVNRKKRH